MLTIDELMAAPAFTVFKGLKGQCECQDVPEDAWDVFGQSGCAYLSDGVLEMAETLGIEVLEQGGDFCAINRSDEEAMHYGLEDFDDVDAALCALNAGYTLVKLPDHLGCKYWRLYVVEGGIPDELDPRKGASEAGSCCVQGP